jgi:hypothetical protein
MHDLSGSAAQFPRLPPPYNILVFKAIFPVVGGFAACRRISEFAPKQVR